MPPTTLLLIDNEPLLRQAVARTQEGTDVGKAFFAQAIHYASPRRHKPFVTNYYSAFPTNLLNIRCLNTERGLHGGGGG